MGLQHIHGHSNEIVDVIYVCCLRYCLQDIETLIQFYNNCISSLTDHLTSDDTEYSWPLHEHRDRYGKHFALLYYYSFLSML